MKQTSKNKATHKMAGKSSEHKVNDTLWQQFEYDDRYKQAKNEAYALQFAKNDIEDEVDYGLEDVARLNNISLSPSLILVWNDVVSGNKQVSDLEGQSNSDYMKAYNVARRLKSRMFQDYLGIPSTRWGRIRLLDVPETDTSWFVESDPNALYAKNGTKLEIARMKARQADADRFQKSIRAYHDRHLKMLDKLSDSIYGFINASLD